MGGGLDEAREAYRVARDQFHGVNGVVKQGTKPRERRAGVNRRPLAEIRIGEIHLEEGEIVGEDFGADGEACHSAKGGEQRLEGRLVFGADRIEAGSGAPGGLFGEIEQQAAFGPETLEECGGRKADLPGDVGKSELSRAEAGDDRQSGVEDNGVGDGAWAGHRVIINGGSLLA